MFSMEKITQIGKAGIDLIKEFEGDKLKSYQDSVGIWTIGYGSLIMPNGQKVKSGDIITEQQAEQLFMADIAPRAKSVSDMIKTQINQNQFDALMCFAYNLGIMSLLYSTLLKEVNTNPNNPDIRNQFAKWVYAGKEIIPGLVRRRKAEADLYFKPM
jgi:lysozyme